MRVVYHPLVQKDVNGILKYYEDVSLTLADEFSGGDVGKGACAGALPEVADLIPRFLSLHAC